MSLEKYLEGEDLSEDEVQEIISDGNPIVLPCLFRGEVNKEQMTIGEAISLSHPYKIVSMSDSMEAAGNACASYAHDMGKEWESVRVVKYFNVSCIIPYSEILFFMTDFYTEGSCFIKRTEREREYICLANEYVGIVVGVMSKEEYNLKQTALLL